MVNSSKKKRTNDTSVLEKDSGKTCRYCVLIFVAIILVQVLCIVILGAHKHGYHTDEVYSYLLSNSYDTDRIANSDIVNDNWVTGEDFMEFVTVQEGEQFGYDKTYYNNTQDAHPPLFYFALHTICSIFPNCFSKWFGIGLNLFFFVVMQIMLYILSSSFLGSNLWGIIPPVLYGSVEICMDTVIFIRMYMMLTMFTVALFLLHYRMLEGKVKFQYLWCYIITFLGIFTQYYFAFVAFYLAIAYCICLLRHNCIKSLIAYSASMILAVATVFILYPAGISQVTGSDTNNIGKEVSSNILNFSNLPTAVVHLFGQLAKRVIPALNTAPFMAAVIIAAIVIAFRKKGSGEEAPKTNKRIFIALFFILSFTFLTIAHISGKYSYVRYIYNIIPLCVIFVTAMIKIIAKKLSLDHKTVAFGLITFSVIGTIGLCANEKSTLMLNDLASNQSKVVKECENRPLIVVSNGKSYFPTGNFGILSKCKELYLATTDEIDVDDLLEGRDSGNGEVFLVITDNEWSNGYDGDEVMTKLISSSEKLSSYSETGSVSFGTVYIAQ